MKWKLAAGVTVGLFAAGVALGAAAQKRGIPKDQIGRWILKGATRRVVRLTDSVRELLPDDPPKQIAEAITEPGPRPGGT